MLHHDYLLGGELIEKHWIDQVGIHELDHIETFR